MKVGNVCQVLMLHHSLRVDIIHQTSSMLIQEGNSSMILKSYNSFLRKKFRTLHRCVSRLQGQELFEDASKTLLICTESAGAFLHLKSLMSKSAISALDLFLVNYSPTCIKPFE